MVSAVIQVSSIKELFNILSNTLPEDEEDEKIDTNHICMVDAKLSLAAG